MKVACVSCHRGERIGLTQHVPGLAGWQVNQGVVNGEPAGVFLTCDGCGIGPTMIQVW